LENKLNFKNFVIFVIFIFLFRLFALKVMKIDLFMDEAYYWYWSKHLAWGYYSKPPFIAFAIKFFTSIFGNNIYGVKIGANIFYSLSAVYIYLISKELFNQKIAFWSGVVFITLPGISYLSEVISTDAFLMFFWSFTLYYFIKALKSDKWIYWILAGIGGGLGLLSKPTMIIFVFSVIFYLLIDSKKTFKNKKLYVAMILAALIYLPNLIWNYYHNFIMFHEISAISKIHNKSHFHPDKFFTFLFAQFGVFGPVFFSVYLYLIFKFSFIFSKKEYKLLYAFSIPFLGIISLQALLERANANWALPTYAAATILVVYYLYNKSKKWLYIGIFIDVLLMAIVYFYHPIMHALDIQLTRKNDFYKRVLGWSELAKKVNPIVNKYPHTKLAFMNRALMSEMIFYLEPNPLNSQLFNPGKQIVNQFAISTDMDKYKHQNFLVILSSPNIKYVEKYFNSCKFLAKEEAKIYKDFSRKAYIYYCTNFKGY